MADHHDDHHHGDGHRDPPSFPIQEKSAIWGLVLAFLAYFLCHSFVYVENDPAAVAEASARGQRVEWTSFDKFYTQSPSLFKQPADHAELLTILKDAARDNHTVKVVGAGHSWSPIGLTDGVMLNLDKFNKIISIDAVSKLVTVQAGIRIRDLSAALAAHDPPLALRNTGVLNRQSLAGALATGTHGTGINYQIMSADVVALEIITAVGEVLRVRRDDADLLMREVFEAATVHLGGLGVITEVTMEVVDAFSVVKRNRLMPLEEVVGRLEELVEGIEHLLIWYVPYTETAQLLEANRTERSKTMPSTTSCSSSSSSSSSNSSSINGDGKEASFSSKLTTAAQSSLLLYFRPFLGVLQVRVLSAAGWFSSLFPVAYVPFLNRYLVAPSLHMFAWGESSYSFYPEGYQGIVLGTLMIKPFLPPSLPPFLFSYPFLSPSLPFSLQPHAMTTAALPIPHPSLPPSLPSTTHTDDHPDQYREAEWFLPYEKFPVAFAAFQQFLEERRGKIGANFVVQLRMTKGDGLWLSPFRSSSSSSSSGSKNEDNKEGEEAAAAAAAAAGSSWYVSIATLVKGYDCEPYFKAAEEEVWLNPLHSARPHWGKVHYLTYNQLSLMYGEEYERYLSVRRRLDPRDMFLNQHLRELFLERAIR